MEKYIHELQQSCIVFLLHGDLGSGKTCFTKGVAQALDIQDVITSPSFTLVKEYRIQKSSILSNQHITTPTLYHLDLWRLENPKELTELHIQDMLKPGNVISIEWTQKYKNEIKNLVQSEDTIITHIKFEYGENEEERKITYN